MSEQGKNKKKKEQVTVRSSAAEYLNYVASVGNDEQQIEMRYEDENIWLTQKLMAMLYGVKYTPSTITSRKYSRTASCRKRQLFENFE